MIKYFQVLVVCALMLLPKVIYANNDLIYKSEAIHYPVAAKNGMVVVQEKNAADAGLQVLKEGGNAVDAAVTIAFALAVTLPRAGNLAGGGFMMVYNEADKDVVAIDYREVAPSQAHTNMFLDKNGAVIPGKSLESFLAIGVPGTVAGLEMALSKYGTISLKRALQPAIKLARDGFVVSAELADSFKIKEKELKKYETTKKIFFKSDGKPYEFGDVLKQTDLADTLQVIADQGAQAFYKGEIANKIVSYIKKNGGVLTKEDLKQYSSIVRKPVVGKYHSYDVYSMPLPSSGGIHLIQMLNMLEFFDVKALGVNNAKSIHLLSEIMRRAYADRSLHLGDSDFVDAPVKGLISKKYAAELVKNIDLARATSSKEVNPGKPGLYKDAMQTTHFSVMDKFGNAVSNTYSLNGAFGMKAVAAGTGMLLNNTMDDFSVKPGAKNLYGLVGGEKNKIEPKKRMLSSMTPTIVLKDKKPYLVTGSPGGSMIITAVLQTIVNVIDHGLNMASAVNLPRMHHQWLPDEIRLDPGYSKDTIDILKKMGHAVKIDPPWSNVNSIMKHDGYFFVAADPRRMDAIALGF